MTTDFYRRLVAPDRDEAHYVRVGRWLSVVFGAVMIGAALTIYLTRTETLMDLQSLLMSILSGGLLGLFLLGFLTRRVDSRSAAVATVLRRGRASASGSSWAAKPAPESGRPWPESFPDRFWIIVLANLALLGLGYLDQLAAEEGFGARSDKPDRPGRREDEQSRKEQREESDGESPLRESSELRSATPAAR